MRLIAQVVVRNEAHRFLNRFLAAVNKWADVVHVYDDQSTDDTCQIAQAHDCWVSRRPQGIPSFLDHEGIFRQEAWSMMEHAVEPRTGQWVMCIDADEFLSAHHGRSVRDVFEAAVIEAEQRNANGLEFWVPEVWEQGPPLMIRTDGFWGTQFGVRAVKYSPGMKFKDRSMACGQTPRVRSAVRTQDLSLLHFGYTTQSDREAKHRRYSVLPGHSERHINSILAEPDLHEWPHAA